MARLVLLVAGVAWTVAGLVAVVVSLMGVELIIDVLPPLAIDAPALGRTILALAAASVVVGMVHVGVALGLGDGRRWAVSAGILLSGVVTMVGIALAAAALTSAAAGTMHLVAALVAALVSALAAVGYGAVGAVLVHRLRAGGPG